MTLALILTKSFSNTFSSKVYELYVPQMTDSGITIVFFILFHECSQFQMKMVFLSQIEKLKEIVLGSCTIRYTFISNDNSGYGYMGYYAGMTNKSITTLEPNCC